MTVLELKDKYDLDVLEVGKDYVYISCGRGLNESEFSDLASQIVKIQEAMA